MSESDVNKAPSVPSFKLSETRITVVLSVLIMLGGFAYYTQVDIGVMLRSGITVLVFAILFDRLVQWSRRWFIRQELNIFQHVFTSLNDPYVVTNQDGIVVCASVGDISSNELKIGASLADFLQGLSSGGHRCYCEVMSILAHENCVERPFANMSLSARQVSDNFILWSLIPKKPNFTEIPKVRVGQTTEMNAAAQVLFGGIADLPDFAKLRIGQGNAVRTTSGEQQIIPLKQQINGAAEYIFLPDDVSNAGLGGSDFEVLPVPMVKLSVEGRILNANADACRLLGISSGDGLALQDLMEGLGRSISDWLTDASHGRGLSHPEFLRLTRRDKEVFVQVSLNKSTDAGRVILIAVLSDATELKTLEAQFVQSQKMQAIGQLAGGVAHDFNNLLTAISGHCDLLLLRHDASDQDFADLVQINQNANRAAALVSQLLAFSRKQTLRPESLDMRDTLSDLTHLLNRLVGEKIDLSLNYDPELRSVRADKRQLEQVIMNLVVNARDAMPSGGRITISTEGEHIASPIIRDRVSIDAGDYVSIKVRDQGCGIPADKVQKIFEPFYTTKRTGEGTGLGLSTVYGIVKQTGGYIFVDSVLEQGTEFNILLPSADSEPDVIIEDIVLTPQKRRSREQGIILLVEDEAPVRTFASRALQLRGYQVLEATCAEDALEQLQDESLKIDVFVTDVVMPGRDGPSWVKEALIKRPNVRVVFMSGYAEDSFETHQAEIKNSVFLPKPFSLTDLTDTVQQQLA